MISKREKHDDCTFVVMSDRGVSHRVNGLPNQDAADFIFKNNDYVVVVSDGVGSCRRAEIGSMAAVESVKSVFLELQANGEQPELHEIAEKIISEWKQLLTGESLNDCCATLKAAMKLGEKLLMLSVGDGLLAVSSRGKNCCAPADNRNFSNQTLCLCEAIKPEDFWLFAYKLDIYVPYVVFVCSDGVSNGIQEGREMDLIEEIENKIAPSALQDELEELLIDISEFSSDDRTVGVVKYERANAKFDR